MALPMVYGGPGRYVQGPGELSRQGRYLSWLGCAAYVLFDQGTEDRLCRQIAIRDAYPKMVIARTKHEAVDYEGIKVVDLARWLMGEGSDVE